MFMYIHASSNISAEVSQVIRTYAGLKLNGNGCKNGNRYIKRYMYGPNKMATEVTMTTNMCLHALTKWQQMSMATCIYIYACFKQNDNRSHVELNANGVPQISWTMFKKN